MAEPDHLRLARLFQGRTDAWGAIHGEAVREHLDLGHWRDHVVRDGSVGVYPLCEDATGAGWVRWGCIDVDSGYEASLPIVRNLWNALGVLGVTSWAEKTKGKGWHLFVLASDWVSATAMRHVQLLACELVDYHPREVNPKAVRLDHGRCPADAECKLDERKPDLGGGADGGRGLLLSAEAASGERSARAWDRAGDDGLGRGDQGQGHSWRGREDRHEGSIGTRGERQADPLLPDPIAVRRCGSHVGALPVDGRSPSSQDQGTAFGLDQPAPRVSQPSGCLALSNYVNAPWARKWVVNGKRVVVDINESLEPYGLSSWLDQAEETLNTPEVLTRVAATYRAPRINPPIKTFDAVTVRDFNFKPHLSPLTYKVLEEGPLPSLETGHLDRSAGLQKLAHLCAKDGLGPSDTYAVVAEADLRWGKYSTRSDCEKQLRAIVERAYG